MAGTVPEAHIMPRKGRRQRKVNTYMGLRIKTDNPPKYPTVKEMFFTSCTKAAAEVAFVQTKDKNTEELLTYAELKRNAVGLGAQLIEMGLKGKHLGIVGENSIEWMTAYYSTVAGVGVAVPIDKELDVETLAYQINYADCEAIFFSGKSSDKIRQVIGKCPAVKYWILMRPEHAKIISDEWLRFYEVINSGNKLPPEKIKLYTESEVKPEDLCDIIFTSGTTGANKGVMLSHKNICAVVHGSLTNIAVSGIIRKSLACLPINHAYEKNCHVLCLLVLGQTVCINDDLMHLSRNISYFDPGISIMVPMILETIQHKVEVMVKKTGLEKHMAYGIKYSNFLRKFGIDKREKFFKPVLDNFGGHFRRVVVGGAPLKEETRKFYDNIGITVVNGYGISECGPLVSSNFLSYQKPGSVGKVIPGCEVKIVNPDAHGDGTVFVRGDNVMMGYYKDPESTARVLTEDGWLDTGDIGHMDRSGFLYLSGRVKNLIILANGKNVFPEEVEEMLSSKITYIKEVVVYTDDEGTGIFASVYLDSDFLRENEVTDPYEYLMNDIRAFNKAVPPYKRIMDVHISDKEFEKTTTKKIKRFTVEKKYQNA